MLQILYIACNDWSTFACWHLFASGVSLSTSVAQLAGRMSTVLVSTCFASARLVAIHCCRRAYDSEFKEQESNPACSFQGLYQVLQFADAVGATKAALLSCLTHLDCLELHVQLEQQQLQLPTDRCYRFADRHEGY
jgi:hypothetical protein